MRFKKIDQVLLFLIKIFIILSSLYKYKYKLIEILDFVLYSMESLEKRSF